MADSYCNLKQSKGNVNYGLIIQTFQNNNYSWYFNNCIITCFHNYIVCFHHWRTLLHGWSWCDYRSHALTLLHKFYLFTGHRAKKIHTKRKSTTKGSRKGMLGFSKMKRKETERTPGLWFQGKLKAICTNLGTIWLH